MNRTQNSHALNSLHAAARLLGGLLLLHAWLGSASPAVAQEDGEDNGPKGGRLPPVRGPTLSPALRDRVPALRDRADDIPLLRVFAHHAPHRRQHDAVIQRFREELVAAAQPSFA